MISKQWFTCCHPNYAKWDYGAEQNWNEGDIDGCLGGWVENGYYAMQNEIIVRNKTMVCKSEMTGDVMR